MELFCGMVAIYISHNPIQHDQTKHVEVDRFFIKQNLESKIMQFPFIKSEDQLADIYLPQLYSIRASITQQVGHEIVHVPT